MAGTVAVTVTNLGGMPGSAVGPWPMQTSTQVQVEATSINNKVVGLQVTRVGLGRTSTCTCMARHQVRRRTI